MKELLGTALIIVLAFLAGLLAFWFRKFLLAGVALALLLSGCDGGSEGDPNSPGDSVNTFNPNAPAPAGKCPVPTGSSFPDGVAQSAVIQFPPVSAVQFFTTSESLSCTDDSLSLKPYKGLSCTDLAGDLWSSSYTAAYNKAQVESVTFLPCCVAVTRTKAHSTSVISPIVGCDAVLDSFGSATGIPSGKYVLCSTSGTFLGWICDTSVN